MIPRPERPALAGEGSVPPRSSFGRPPLSRFGGKTTACGRSGGRGFGGRSVVRLCGVVAVGRRLSGAAACRAGSPLGAWLPTGVLELPVDFGSGEVAAEGASSRS
jgi:hypothetical protein